MVYEACEQRLKECSGQEAIALNTRYQGGVAVGRIYPRLRHGIRPDSACFWSKRNRFWAKSGRSVGSVQTRNNDECLTQIRRRHFDVAPALRWVVHGLCRIDSIHVGSRRVYLSRLDRYLAIALNTPYQGGVAVVSRTYLRLSVWRKTRFRLFSSEKRPLLGAM